MKLDPRFRRRLPMVAGLVLVLVALGAAFEYSRAATAQLWSDQPVAVAPAPVAAPNWVALAEALKPAVVNVSMKRGAQPTPEAVDPFFQQFFGRVPPRAQRGLGSGFVVNRRDEQPRGGRCHGDQREARGRARIPRARRRARPPHRYRAPEGRGPRTADDPPRRFGGAESRRACHGDR